MTAEGRCAYGDKECFGMVVPVFGGCLKVDRSKRQGDVIVFRAVFLIHTFA